MARLGDICTIYTGTGFPVQYQGSSEGQYPFYKVGDIAKNVTAGNKYLSFCENYIEADVAKKIKGTVLPSRTVVFAKIGEAVKLNRRAITSCECLIDNNAMGIAPNETVLTLDYFFHYMCSLHLETLAEATTVPSVKKSLIEKLDIPLPSISEQQRIAACLNKVTELIALRKEQLAALDQLVKSQFIELFGDPKCWNTGLTNLGDHIDLINGYAFLSENFIEEGIPVIKIRNVNNADFSHENMQYHAYDSNLDKYLVRPGDLLISLTGTVGKEDFANVCIVDDSYEEYYLNQRNAKLQPHEELIPEYLLHVLKQDYVKKELIKKGTGVRQCHLHNKDVNSVQLIIPEKALQQQFAAFVEQTDKSKLAIQQSLDKLETLKKALMQKYFG